MKTGIVKWYRDDGAGYIIPDDKSKNVLVDKSSLNQDESLEKGQRVLFTSKNVLGVEIATKVEVLWISILKRNTLKKLSNTIKA